VARVDPAATETRFADNTRNFVAVDRVRAAVLQAIKDLKQGHETFDLTTIKQLLADDYKRHLVVAEGKVITETRRDFLAARSEWMRSAAPRRDLQYAVMGIAVSESRTPGVTVVALSTYRSTHFNPRFLETLRFSSRNGEWLLAEQTLVPLTPTSPEQFDVRILAVPWSLDTVSHFSDIAVSVGADELMNRLTAGSKGNQVPSDGTMGQILMVFREPPPVGSVITVQHFWSGPTSLPEYKFEYTVTEIRPFFILENLAAPSCCPGNWAQFAVFVDGDKVASQTAHVQ